MTNFQLSVLFFLQYAVILAACRGVAVVARWVGQPPVVSEMIAGVLLGRPCWACSGRAWKERSSRNSR